MKLNKKSILNKILSLSLLSLTSTSLNLAWSANCLLDSKDPFEPNAVMSKGDFQGQCLGTQERRSVRLLTLTEAAAYFDADTLKKPLYFMANISHEGQYWVGAFPKPTHRHFSPIAKAIFQVEYFAAIVPAAHTQIRFVFEKGLEPLLVTQSLANERRTLQLPELIYTIEAVPARGGPGYDVIKGAFDQFGLAFRWVSLADKIQSMLITWGDQVDQYDLNLTGKQLNALYTQSVDRSVQDPEMHGMYNTVTANCTNLQFEVLDKVLKRDRNPYDQVMTTIPTLSPGELSSRKIIRQKLPSLNDETGHPAWAFKNK